MSMVTKEQFEKERFNEVIAKKLITSRKVMRRLDMELKFIDRQAKKNKRLEKAKEKKDRVRRNWFTLFLLTLSTDIFMWAMRREKKKYPIYWSGPHFKHFKYSTWYLVFANCLRARMKLKGRAACVIFDGGKIASAAKLDLYSGVLNDLYYERLCLAGARIFREEARLKNEKSFKLEEVDNADSSCATE